ncbi:MAG: aldehyde dehydrogenase family protein [Spirochaetota bacterium]
MSAKEYKNYIGGEWLAPASGEYSELRDPGDQSSVLGRFPRGNKEETVLAIQAAHDAAPDWARTPPSTRASILMKFASLLEEHTDEVAEILTREEGKILSEAKGEVGRAVAETRFMAGEVFRTGGQGYPSEKPGGEVIRRRVPIGPVGIITPWNFPVVSPVRKISPALAYGDTVVFKPATLTPWTALRLTELYEEAGVPAGVLNTVCGSGREVGDTIVSSPLIRGITFTGSTGVGRAILAKSADTLTKVQLEMGGKNAALVFDADDLDIAAKEIVAAAYSSSGQRCTAISRVVVSDAEHDELVRKMKELAGAIRVGYGMDDSVQMGPLVSQEQIETSERYVKQAVADGATVVCGGERIESDKDGFYYAPTIVDDVKRDTALAREEVFGPVLAVLRASSFEEGVAICNDTPYGLAGCVFTRYLARAREFADQVVTGMVHINHGTASQPHVPFGGAKESGFGSFSIGPSAQDFYLGDKIVYYAG